VDEDRVRVVNPETGVLVGTGSLAAIGQLPDERVAVVLDPARPGGKAMTATYPVEWISDEPALGQLHKCEECGHLHWMGPEEGYAPCPIEGCLCEGQLEPDAELHDEIRREAEETEIALRQFAELLERLPDARSKFPSLLPELQGEEHGWLGGPFVIDELRKLAREGEER